MSEMQTLLADCLDMEWGTSKEQTGKEHLERADFILAKQKQEAEQVKAAPGAEDRGATPHRHGGEPGNGGGGQDHRAVAGCTEIESGHSEHYRRYSLQGKRGVQASH